MADTIAEAGIDDVDAIVDVTLQSFEDAFNKPFYMEREAAIRRWKAYMRKEHHPRDANKRPADCLRLDHQWRDSGICCWTSDRTARIGR